MHLTRPAALACALIASLVCAAPAAAAPSPALHARQVESLRAGGAILQVEGGRSERLALARRLASLDAHAFRRLPLVRVRGSRAELVRAARLPGVVAVHRDERLALDLNRSVPLVFAGGLDAARAAGHDGAGVNVAVIDSGVDGLHPDLRDRVVRNVKVVDHGAPVYVECPSACNTDTTGGHGTHVAGIAAGGGEASEGFYTGVAPRAGIVALGVGEGPLISYALAAFDYLLAHPELGVVAVNNSWGRPQSDGAGRYDSTHPINVATKRLHAAGTAVVFSAGNTGTGGRTSPAGASECDTVPASGGGREAGDGICRFTIYGSAPWTISVGMSRSDGPAGDPGAARLNYFSSRGDPFEQLSLDGVPVTYLPTLTAPGVNVRAARDPIGVTSEAASCGSAEPPACTNPPRPEYEPWYLPLTGTSMAAPHVTGAIAVVQSVARRRLGRLLTPDEVRGVLVASAAPMRERDAFWDWPCGSAAIFVACGNGGPGSNFPDTTGRTYERYQAGAGHLDVRAAVARVEAMGG